MPQGSAKKSVQRLANQGSRVSKPQKAKKKKVSAKFTSGLITQTEALLSQRAGNMRVVGNNGGSKVGKPLKKGATKKGGSKKFG